MRIAIAIVLTALLAGLGTSPAGAEKRIALVIGNGSYKDTTALPNPRNDATDLAVALRRLNFDVMVDVDLEKRAMERLIREFDRKLPGSDIAFFYYAGHGMQVSGQNYLVPIDARLATEADIDFESVPLRLIMKRMEREAKISIILLDACRDNPLARNLARVMGTRSANLGRGLSRVESGIGALIGFSTQPGNSALDGEGRNSPYARALLEEIEQPGRDVLSTMAAVRGRVVKATNGFQVPWEHTSLLGPVVLMPERTTPKSAPEASEAARMWQMIENTEDIAVFEAFRRQFGAASPAHDQLATNKITALKSVREAAARHAEEEQKRARAERDRLAALKAQEDARRADEEKKRTKTEEERLAALKAEEARKRADDEKKRAKTEEDRLAALKLEQEKTRADEEKRRAKAEEDRVAALKAEDGRRRDADEKRAKAEAERLAALKAQESAKQATKAEADKKQAAAARMKEIAALQKDQPPTGSQQSRQETKAARRDPALAVAPGTGQAFRDQLASGQPCPHCPEMVVAPEGEFLMGSAPGEIGTLSADRPDLARYFNWEAPQRAVKMARRVAVGRMHVTRGEFAAFVAATGHKTDAGCFVHEGGDWNLDTTRSWRSPGFEQTDRHPVVCVNWSDANAYAQWLSKATGSSYRLLSEAEAEYVARATARGVPMPAYSFGGDAKGLCAYGNGASQTGAAVLGWERHQVAPCESGYVHTAPAGSFKANAWGLHDVHGNVWSWTGDCWNDSHANAAADGSARTVGDCARRVVRGGSWANAPRDLRSAVRDSNAVGDRSGNLGFRLAREVSY